MVMGFPVLNYMTCLSNRCCGLCVHGFSAMTQGTWPALFNLLERRGRVSPLALHEVMLHSAAVLLITICPMQKPQHTFMDYCFCNYVVAIIIALTLGEVGDNSADSPSFTTQVHQVWCNTGRASTSSITAWMMTLTA